jgi:phage terminase large subunit
MQKVKPYQTLSPVFEWNWNTRAEVVINQGGTSSGKTYSILQVLLLRCITEPRSVCTVVAGDIPDLKSGALRDTQLIISDSEYVQAQIQSFNTSERVFKFANGSIMEFKSYENQYDARSGKRDYCFLNEAQNVKHEVYEELHARTRKQVYIDYNPTQRFWAHDLIGRHGVQLFISNFNHNPFLDDRTRAKILRYKTENPARWRVYWMGLTGEVEGSIFKAVYQASEFPDADQSQYVYGMDFGYSNDPTTLVRVLRHADRLYGQELIYQTGMSNEAIVRKLEALGIPKHARIIADSADPKAIDHIRNAGYNIRGAAKGPDSVKFGIEEINSYAGGIHLVGPAENWWREQENYVWQKKAGRYINQPVDDFNHIWDAFRYAVMDMKRKSGVIHIAGNIKK